MKIFQFKQFAITQDKCAMKVGTDGVLLGAWVDIQDGIESVLDIGAGTGLLALQMAQRSGVDTIDAVELHNDAFEQCVENFEASEWSDRLFCYHASFQEFFQEIDETYDLLIANPPFFTEEVSSGNTPRDKARQERSLPFEHLLFGAAKLLSSKGSFAVIIPFSEEGHFLELAKHVQLFPNRITRVRGNKKVPVKRSLLQLSRNQNEIEIKELVIEKERHVYTQEYINLTKDFYLKM
ncbi:tRNA1(Val) (adenine(37)-N6)-methyltransferase [Croceivirga lutea]|uniref:tRNA1(Val) (adenine(37)-N6)-methyltransferase n=1 Tax=Croceivirga lutea TaxID=1775167 RepID=UPI001639F05E|nr:methyltransferase [Croceivirga lutea]GGG41766.1 tRNA1(Val) (adenine(37)-N6)-methyltransferase [Croceivirga lutea]